MTLDPRRLVILAEVERLGGVLSAAHALNVTPSAVSQQIGRLEREAGLALLARSGRGVVLTAAGRTLAMRGARVAAELAAADADVTALADGVLGRVVVAGFPSAVAGVVVPAVAGLRRAHPALVVRILEVPADVCAAGLRSGTVDLELVDTDPGAARQASSGHGETVLLDDPFVLAVPHAGRPGRVMADLGAQDWIQGPVGSTTRSVLQRFARDHGFEPRVVHEALEYPAVLAMVRGGLGCALVPRLVVTGEASRAGGDLGVDVVEAPGLGHRRIAVRYRTARHEPSRAAIVVHDALVSAARRVAGALRPQAGHN